MGRDENELTGLERQQALFNLSAEQFLKMVRLGAPHQILANQIDLLLSRAWVLFPEDMMRALARRHHRDNSLYHSVCLTCGCDLPHHAEGVPRDCPPCEERNKAEQAALFGEERGPSDDPERN